MRPSLTCVSGRRPELTSSLEQLERFYDGVRSASSGGSGGSEVVLRCAPHGHCRHLGCILPRVPAIIVRTGVVDKCKAELVPSYGRFLKKKTRPLRMEVNAYQAAILLLFNRPGVRAEGLALREIASALNIELETARRYAISLSLNKYKALRKGDDSIKKTVGDDELLRPNEKLAQEIVDKRTKRPRPRVSFPVPKAAARAQREAEDGAVDMAVQEERKHAIEAAVVRTMKMERTMKSQELVLAVVSQLAYLFKAEPRYIKKRVADLIDREFIVRDEENPMTLHYVA